MTGLRYLLLLLILLPGLSACGANANEGSGKASPGFFESAVVRATQEPLDSGTAVSAPASSPTRSPTRPASQTASPTLQPPLTSDRTAAPSSTSTPAPDPLACLEEGGRITHGSLSTDLLRFPLVYRVYLPPCYRDRPQERYPVLYLIHGQGFKDDQWDRIGADETADRLIAAGEIPPLIIVMPYERYGGQPTESNFAKALVELLVPHIDETYRTRPSARDRAVGGLSRGGGWAIHFGTVYWKVFGALGAHSPAVFHTDAQYMRTFLDAIPPEVYPRIYIDIGERDRPEILRSAVWFEKLLDEKDIPHEWHLFSGYHNEAYWTEHMPFYLRWYAQYW